MSSQRRMTDQPRGEERTAIQRKDGSGDQGREQNANPLLRRKMKGRREHQNARRTVAAESEYRFVRTRQDTSNEISQGNTTGWSVVKATDSKKRF